MKMSDKGVDSSEIVMLPSLQKGYGYRCRCAPKKLISQGYRCPQCLKLAKKVSFYNIASEASYVNISVYFLTFEKFRFLVDFEVFWGRFSNSVLSWKSVLKGKNIPCANAINPDTIITTGHEFSELYRRQGNFHLSFFLPSLALCSFAYGFFGSINLCLTCCRDP